MSFLYQLFLLLLVIRSLFGLDDLQLVNQNCQNSSGNFSKIVAQTLPFLSKQKFMSIEIDGKQLLAMIDTGAACSFIRQDVLDGIQNKEYLFDNEIITVRGNHFILGAYYLPNVKIGNFHTQGIFREEGDELITDFILENRPRISWKSHLAYQVIREAVIGMDFLQNYACVLDFPHASLYLGTDLSEIMECEVFSTAEFHSFPCEIGTMGVILSFETDFGKKRFLLDTGSTISLLRPSEINVFATDPDPTYCTSNILRLGLLDFGRWQFRLIEISETMNDLDGILGMDFFSKHVVCFDFKNKTVHIQTPKLGSKERFNYWVKSCLKMK